MTDNQREMIFEACPSDDEFDIFDILGGVHGQPESQSIFHPEQEDKNKLLTENEGQLELSNSIESNTGPSTPHQTPLNNENSKPQKQRWDQRLKNLPQNVGSTVKTMVPKILSKNSSKVKRKSQIRERKGRLQEFLKLHNAGNNQFIIAFCYLFVSREGAQPNQFVEIGTQLTKYLNKRIAESADFQEEEKEMFVERVNIHKRIVSQYFDGNCTELDFEWLKNVGGDLFTGRQANTIGKPLKELEEIQKTLTGQRIQLQTPIYCIQEFFESDSGNE